MSRSLLGGLRGNRTATRSRTLISESEPVPILRQIPAPRSPMSACISRPRHGPGGIRSIPDHPGIAGGADGAAGSIGSIHVPSRTGQLDASRPVHFRSGQLRIHCGSAGCTRDRIGANEALGTSSNLGHFLVLADHGRADHGPADRDASGNYAERRWRRHNKIPRQVHPRSFPRA